MRLFIIALLFAISYAQTGTCNDNSPITGSDDWNTCKHSRTYTCNSRRSCCCEDGFEPDLNGYCLVCATSDSPIHTGDSIYFRSQNTGKYIEVENEDVRARFDNKGDWQKFIIEKDSQGDLGVIFSGESVDLVAHTGNHMEMVFEKNSGGAILPGDTVYLKIHTGEYIDVEDDWVRARWADKGSFQALTVEELTPRHHSNNWLETNALLDSKISFPLAMIVYELRWNKAIDEWERELEQQDCNIDRTNFGAIRNDKKPNEWDEFAMIYEVVCSGRKEMVIAYPGTETMNDVASDLASALHQLITFNQRTYDAALGFSKHYENIQASTSPDNSFPGTFEEFIKQRFEEIRPDMIRVVGHSLGGALAALQAVDLQEQRGDWLDDTPIALSTFGQPRVFQDASAEQAQSAFGDGNSFGNYAYRYVNYGDPVPSCPGAETLGFKHFGTAFYSNYRYRLTSWGWYFTREHRDFTPHHVPGLAYTNHFRHYYRDRLNDVRDRYNLNAQSSASLSAMVANTAPTEYIFQAFAIFGVFSCANVVYKHFANSEKDYSQV